MDVHSWRGSRFSFCFAIAALASGVTEAAAPTCANPVGSWENQLESVLKITSYDAATGAIVGEYKSPSGGGGSFYPMTGWVNSAAVNQNDPCKDCKKSNMVAIAFAVRWAGIGSITAWAGTCGTNPKTGKEELSTVWHLTRPNSSFQWDHILTGADLFDPLP